MGYGTGKQKALEWISCTTKAGNYSIIDSIPVIRLNSRAYMKKLSEILALAYNEINFKERPITW